MTAERKSGFAYALKRERDLALAGIEEGEERRQAYADWLEELSDALGYDQKSLKNWMKGRHDPNHRAAEDITEFFTKSGPRFLNNRYADFPGRWVGADEVPNSLADEAIIGIWKIIGPIVGEHK